MQLDFDRIRTFYSSSGLWMRKPPKAYGEYAARDPTLTMVPLDSIKRSDIALITRIVPKTLMSKIRCSSLMSRSSTGMT